MFSSKDFMVSGLTFRSFNPFLNLRFFFFFNRMRQCTNLTLWHAAVQFSQHHLWKKLSFLYCIFLPPLLKIDHKCMALFLGSQFCSTDLHVCFCASAMLFGSLYFYSLIWCQGTSYKQVCSFFSRLF